MGNALAPKLQTEKETITRFLVAIKQNNSENNDLFKTSQLIETIDKQWSTIANTTKFTTKASFTQHTQLISVVLQLITTVANQSNLILDPDLDTFYLMDLSTVALPELIEVLGTIRGIASAAAMTKDQLNKEELLSISLKLYQIDLLIKRTKTGLDTAFNNTKNDTLKAALSSFESDLIKATKQFGQLITTEIWSYV